jgi:FMN phosphatase YigB (HAD superfamily)
MTITLLLDLDNTLLDLDFDVFLQAYFKKLAGYLAARVNPGRLIDELVVGTNLMLSNERPDSTLESVFSDYFYPALGLQRADLEPEIQRFYDEVFPSLKEYSSAPADAVPLVETALEKGWRVAVATNPVFPRKAVLERLRWANLPPEKYPFAWITSMETSHFTKNSPAYYLELLGYLGWPDGPILMAGDDTSLDVDSALRAGLPAFWVRPDGTMRPELVDLPQGRLGELGGWLETVSADLLAPSLKNPEALIYSLQSTPAVLDTLIRDLRPADWTTPSRKGEWALVEIICHLRDLDAEVNVPRVRALIAEDGAFIAGQDTDPWADERHYIQQDGPAAFRDFVTARLSLLAALKGISHDGWGRRARHTIFGPTTLQELVGFMGEHDRTHIRQVMALIAALGGAS